jgi:hypothetical protein
VIPTKRFIPGGIFWQLELDYNGSAEKSALFIGSLQLMHVPSEMVFF